jgi:hypothetical protein
LWVVSMLDRPVCGSRCGERWWRKSSRWKGWRRRVARVLGHASLVAAVMGKIRRFGNSRALRLTAAVVPGRKAFVELAFADKTDTVFVGCSNVMKGVRFTILLVVGQVVVQDQVLDPLLLLALGLLLRAHCNSESGVRRQIDRACL